MSACEHVSVCPLFRVFSMSSCLGVWKRNYCDADWRRCERHRRVVSGEAVPPNLLPNGRTLVLAPSRSRAGP